MRTSIVDCLVGLVELWEVGLCIVVNRFFLRDFGAVVVLFRVLREFRDFLRFGWAADFLIDGGAYSRFKFRIVALFLTFLWSFEADLVAELVVKVLLRL